MAAAHPELRVDVENQIVYRADAPISNKVGLISGGGSGHEPMHGGFVGPGMLDAAAPGAVASVARKVNERSRSFGTALTSGTTPAAGTPTFDLGEDEIELGIGIHGEPGRTRRKIGPASELVQVAADAILADYPFDRGDQ